ncbi:MAG: HAMP domain-containing sensor histidine kinase [Methyloligellaceae bacterium]
MRLRSLRLRLLLAAACAIALALTAAGLGIVFLFERHVERRIGAELDTYLNQLAARITFSEEGTPRLTGKPADPRFEKVYSGLYWQVHDEGSQATLRSRSLWDATLKLPQDRPALGTIHIHDIPGPRGTQLLVHERRLAYATPAGEKILRLAVAIDRQEIAALSAAFGKDVLASLLVLGLALLLAAWLQVNVGLRPLAMIRRGLAEMREGRSERLDVDVPAEIAPLVEELNALLESQAKAMQRARDRAADLAHGFKTPLTALLADARRLREKGEDGIAAEIEHTADLMRAQIERELTRSRIRNAGAAPVDVAAVAAAIINTLRRTPHAESLVFETHVEDGLAARIERDDLHEVLGNLLENAARHARQKVLLRAARQGTLVRIDIEDDGPGIPAAQRDALIDRGKRLDASGAGSGLGLAIANDVLDHYGQKLTLEHSECGGLKASFTLPA